LQPRTNFDAYRSRPPRTIGAFRTAIGVLIVIACWLAMCVALIGAAIVFLEADMATFFSSPEGLFTLFASFSGIWLGVWLAMRFLHREPVAHLLGASGPATRSDFARGFLAVVLTSILSEVLIYLMRPEFEFTDLGWRRWLVYALPVAVLCLIQTSAEEILFRGYLTRNLANRFGSPWIWAVLPSLAFIALHVSSVDGGDVLLIFLSIGSLTVALVLVVHLTGNLGAALGMHFGNNLFAFLVVAHQAEFGAFALFRGASIDDLGTGYGKSLALGAIAILCVGVTLVLLLARSSPIRLSHLR